MNQNRKPARAIVLLPPIAGLSDYTVRVEDRLRRAGYEVSSIDYYGGKPPPDISSPQKILEVIKTLASARVLQDVLAAVAAFKDRQLDSVGVLGFCIGGAYAMLAGAELPGIKAAVNFYGSIHHTEPDLPVEVSPLHQARRINVPLISHYGSADKFIPRSDVDALERALTESGRTFEIFRYGGAPHAFDEDFREAYRPVASAEAWARTLTFLDWYLPAA